MKPPNDDVVQAIQDCLRHERTAIEYFHDMERAAKRRGWKEIKKRFDKWVARAKCRRHELLDVLYEYDTVPDPASDTYEMPFPDFEPTKVFSDVRDFFQSAIDCYNKGIPILYEAGVFGKPLSALDCNLKGNECGLLKCEQILGMIKDLGGDEEYLAEQF